MHESTGMITLLAQSDSTEADRRAFSNNTIALSPDIRMSVALAKVCGPFLPVVETILLWSSHRKPELTLRGPCISSRRVWSIRINSSSISCASQPHLQAISWTEKLGVIICSIRLPVAMRKILR